MTTVAIKNAVEVLRNNMDSLYWKSYAFRMEEAKTPNYRDIKISLDVLEIPYRMTYISGVPGIKVEMDKEALENKLNEALSVSQ